MSGGQIALMALGIGGGLLLGGGGLALIAAAVQIILDGRRSK